MFSYAGSNCRYFQRTHVTKCESFAVKYAVNSQSVTFPEDAWGVGVGVLVADGAEVTFIPVGIEMNAMK